jgi:S1-C subfamily serine protease
MFRPRLWAFSLAGLVLICSSLCFAKDKAVKFETIPTGARVEVDGSVACTTPCSINLPSYYFGFKFTAFSKHAKSPVSVRLRKDGCAPKTITITAGPIPWKNGLGITVFTFYQVTSPRFTVQLDAPDDPVKSDGSAPPEGAASDICSATSLVATKKLLESEMPAVVAISTSKGWTRGFLISSDGLIVADALSISDRDSVSVTLPDGKIVETPELYFDEDHGLALVKVQGSNYPFLRLSKTLPQAGADVFAIDSSSSSNPIGTNAIAQAIVGAALKTDVGAWVETDGALNRDDPGTPLLDRDGQVVGVNTRKDSSRFKGQNVWAASPDVEKFVESHFKVNSTALDPKR